MLQRNGRRKKTTAREDRHASKRLKQNMQLPDQIWLLLFLLCVEVNAPVVECLGDYWRRWIFILLCPYVTFVIIMSLLYHKTHFRKLRGTGCCLTQYTLYYMCKSGNPLFYRNHAYSREYFVLEEKQIHAQNSGKVESTLKRVIQTSTMASAKPEVSRALGDFDVTSYQIIL